MATADMHPQLERPIPLHERRYGRRAWGKLALSATIGGGAITAIAAPDKVADALDYIANALDPHAESERPDRQYVKIDHSGEALLDAGNHIQITRDQTIVDVDSYAADPLNTGERNDKVAVFKNPTDDPNNFVGSSITELKATSGTIVFGNTYNSSVEFGHRLTTYNGQPKIGGLWFSPRDKAGNAVDAKTGQLVKEPQYIKLANVRIKKKSFPIKGVK